MEKSSNKLAYQTVLQEGREEGKKKCTARVIKNMIMEGLEDSFILRMCPETIATIKKLRKDFKIPNPAQKTD